jgi:VanZ family protein
MRSLFFRWIPVLFWMGVIFKASTDAFSAQHTGSVLVPFLLRFFPHLSAEAIDMIHFCIRKGAHLAEYSILAMLLWRAVPERKARPDAADWGRAGVALAVATFYGATDEFHQIFVPSRGASVHDVLIDACGAAITLTCVCLVSRRRAARKSAAAA